MNISTGKFQGQQFGNYRLESLIGQGGFAEVYLGEHIYLKTKAAIKLLHTRVLHKNHEEFLAEAQTIASLRHNHIVQVLDYGVEGNIPYLVMEYAPNRTLLHRHPRGSVVPTETIVTYVRQAADALQYAHNQKLAHRDIKPENLLLGPSNEVLLGDFGIALAVQSSRHGKKQEIAGTISYMAPEQILGYPQKASDQYALGVVVYEWLCGDRPFRGKFAELAYQHVSLPPQPLHEKVPTISPALEAVVLRALAKEPQERFPDVTAFADALEQASDINQPTDAMSLPDSSPAVFHLTSSSFTPAQVVSTAYQTQPGIPDSSVQSRRKIPTCVKALFVLLALLIIVGSGLVYFSKAASHLSTSPDQLTVTAQTNATARVQAMYRVLYNKDTDVPPVFDDPLSAKNTIDWTTGNSCMYTGEALHITKSNIIGSTVCNALYSTTSNFNNIVYQIQVMFIRGDKDSYAGLVFRSDNLDTNQQIVNYPSFYEFEITPEGGYVLYALNGNRSARAVVSGTSLAIKTGLNHVNLLTVIADRTQMHLYVNRQYVATGSDNTSSTGAIGVVATYTPNAPIDVAFKDAQVWLLA